MKKIIKYGFIILALFIMVNLFITKSDVFAAQTYGLTDEYLYNIKNRNSGKYLNVNYGTDANGTNVNQFTDDGSYEQKFAIVYSGDDKTYKIFAYCSSESLSRVVDVYRPLQNNANVDIWANGDDDAQFWKIEHLGNGYYSIKLAYNTNLALTAYGTGNGGGSGTSSTSIGNVFISTYTGATNQQWSFIQTPALLTWDLVTPDKHLYYEASTSYLTSFNTAVNTWNNLHSGLIQSSFSNVGRITVSDYTESNTNVVGETSSSGTIRFNTYYMSGYGNTERVNVCTHELGHALRLKHRRELTSVMYPEVSSMTALSSSDIWNFNKAYLLY